MANRYPYTSVCCIPDKDTEIHVNDLECESCALHIGQVSIILPEIEVAKEIAELLKNSLKEEE